MLERDRLRKREFSLCSRLGTIKDSIFWAQQEVLKLKSKQTRLQQEQYKAEYALAMADGRYHKVKAEKKDKLDIAELMLTLNKDQLKNILNVLEED